MVEAMWPAETGFEPGIGVVDHPKKKGYLAQVYDTEKRICLWRFTKDPSSTRTSAFSSLISQLKREHATHFVAEKRNRIGFRYKSSLIDDIEGEKRFVPCSLGINVP